MMAGSIEGHERCFRRQAQRVGAHDELLTNLLIGEMRCEPRLLRHDVLELEITPIHLANLRTEIADGRENEQREQAAVGAPTATRLHHCDCAPSTMSLTINSMANRRPSASARSAYSPSRRRPLRENRTLPRATS